MKNDRIKEFFNYHTQYGGPKFMQELTKAQAVGYMLQALFRAGCPYRFIGNFFVEAITELEENETMDNFESWDFLEKFLCEKKLMAEEIKEIRGALYTVHDTMTPEKARSLYIAWGEILFPIS